jgi:hypothetical protein
MFEVTLKAAGEITSFRVSEMSILITPLSDLIQARFDEIQMSEIYILSILPVTVDN